MHIANIVTTPFGMKPMQISTIGGKILDIVFTKSAVLLNDQELLFPQSWNAQIAKTNLGGLPIPLLGFTYKIPDRLPLLRFKYSEYPFLTKNIISNCYMQEQTKFSIQAYNFLTTGIGVFTNIGFNMILRSVLEKYRLQGGTFMVMTPWGHITPCLCESIEGVTIDDKDIGGQSLIFSFTTAKIAKKDAITKMVEALGG